MKEASWPAAARPILTAFLMTEDGAQRANATPRFILAQGDKVVFTTTGNAGWKEKMWPKLLEVTGAKA